MKNFLLALLFATGILNAQTTVTIGSNSFVNGTQESSPINIWFKSHHCQILYTATELNAAGLVGASEIKKLGFNIYGGPSEGLPNYNIKLKNTSSNNLSTYESGLNTVYTNTLYAPSPGGFELLTFDNSFIWDGSSNLLVDVCFDQVNNYTATGQVYLYNSGSDAFYRYIRNDGSPQCGETTTEVNNNNKPQLQLEFVPLANCSGTPNAGEALSTSTLVCANTSFDLSLVNGTIASGLSFQWQSSSDGNVWTDLGSSQSGWIRPITNILNTTHYRCVTTCTISALSATSTPVVVVANPLINCYCMPGYSWDCTNERFLDISIANLSASTVSCDIGGFSDLTTVPAAEINLNAGNTYTLIANTTSTGSAGNSVAGAWIDYNQNNIFESSEFTYLGYGYALSYTNTLTVPLLAQSGSVRMRLKLDASYASSGTSIDPCFNNNGSSYGQIVDYKVNITAAPACSGTPNLGNAVSTSSSVCPATSYTLDLTGNDLVSGLSYQWQSSADGSTWTNSGSAQNTIAYNIASQNSTTHYRCVATCTNGGASGTSNPVVVNTNLLNCYCVPGYSWDCNYGRIADFNLASTVINGINCEANGYTDSTASNYININLNAANTYTLLINTTTDGTYGNAAMGAWIDYNQNAIFDSQEFISLGYGTASTYSTPFTVPLVTPSGTVRMRLKLDNNNAGSWTTLDPCNNNNGSSYGQIIDFKVNITAAPACSAAPNLGNAVSSLGSVCSFDEYTLNLTGNDQVSGLSYQWQSSPNGSTWTNLGSAQNTILYTANSQTATTHFRCVATCTNGGAIGTSNPVIVNQNLPTACYCIPELSNCSTAYFSNVIIETLNDNPTCNSGVNGYLDNTVAVPSISVSANQSYTISTTTSSQGPPTYTGVWVDYDHNGIFAPNEYSYIGFSNDATPLTGTINIPYTAIGGDTRMRLKMDATYGSFSGIDPCYTNDYDGQTIDYLLNITPVTPCTGMPNAGDAISSYTSSCENRPFTLDLVNNDVVSNIWYQWQQSTDGTNWANIGTSQSSIPYTVSSQSITTYYRCELTCASSSSISTSSTFTMTQKPTTECYCIPPPSNCNNSDVINTVVFSNLTNTSTCSTDGYEDYTLNGSIITPTVNTNQSYPINVTVGREYYEYVTVWVDFDKNGNFEADEYTNIGAPAGSGNFTATGSILIPSNATLGTTRMRIRTNYNSPFYDYEACEGSNGNEELRGPSQGSGETEDYSITILPPDCSTINFPPSVSLSGVLDICPGGSTTLDIATSIPLATGITYQWKAFDGSSYVDEGSATPSSSIIVTPGSNTPYYCEIFCNATSTRISDTVTVKLNPVTTALTFTNASCSGLCDGSIQLNATSSGGLLTYSWSPSLPNADQVITLCAGTYSVIVSNTVGCTATETVSITEPTPLTASLTTTDVTCNGLNNGSISVVANGGTPAYTYSWAPTFGNSSTINGLSAGTYTCMIYDINGCFINEYATVNEPGAITATIAGFSSTICEQLNDTLKSTIVGGIAPYTYSWNQLPGSIVSTDPIYSYSTSVGTFSYNLTITDNTGCSANSNTLVITVNPSSNISGLVTTNTTTPVAGRVVLFQYLPFYTKFDSVAGQNIDPSGNYNFVSFKAGIYIVKAIPSAGNLQIAYGDSAVNWKTAKQILHGCSTNDVQNIEVKALSSFTTTGSGTLSGKITKALGFDQRPGSSFKPSAPGEPIGGIVVKGGKNPGGQMFVQTVTEPVGGTYTLTGLPINEAGESYFILVDIPGLDTNNTYHRIIDITNNEYNNLDFTVDSAKINPVNEPFVSVSVNDISAKLNQIKVFPNPATNKVIIQYNLAINSAVKIELFDILGKSVKTILPLTNQINTNYSYTVLLDDLTSGMYFMKLNINNSESTIKLIINN